VKPIQGLDGPTPGLGDFVRQFPEEHDWEIFKVYANGRPYAELLAALVEKQHGLCCYCEVDLVELDWQVEHFHSKRNRSFAVNLTTDHRNLLAACCGGTRSDLWGNRNPREAARAPLRHRDPTKENLSCGQAKDRHEPNALRTAVIDPRQLPTALLVLRVALDGRLEVDEAACTTAGLDPGALGQTIRILGLNCERLRIAREDRLKFLAESFKGEEDIEILLAAARQNLLPDADGRLFRFFTTSRSFFREAAEAVLAEPPQAWI
jgi:uncharacterized protein (TIGR02646 family)